MEAILSLRAEVVEEMTNTHDVAMAGRLFDYRETAIRALEEGGLAQLPISAQQRAEMAVDLARFGTGFLFSPDHLREDLKVARWWYAVLRAYRFIRLATLGTGAESVASGIGDRGSFRLVTTIDLETEMCYNSTC